MKKFVSFVLSFVMLLSVFCSVTFAEDGASNTVTVYVTISKYGEILTDQNGQSVAMTPVTLSGKDVYVLDDVFQTVHTDLCASGISGYETATGDYGLYITKFWEDTSGNFTYQVNFGEESVWGPTHEIANGDYVEFCINQSMYPFTEAYTRFDKRCVGISAGAYVDLTLTQGEYAANGMCFSPCPDAVITINGIATDVVTDTEGNASVCFEEPGEYVISAVKTKVVQDASVTAIAAPVCLVTVEDAEIPPADIPTDTPADEPEDIPADVTAEQQMHNIVQKYLADSVINDGNMHWFIADFADYLKIYPESRFCLTDTQKQSCVDKMIALADTSSSQGDLAKVIIALRALGYDAKNTYNKNGVVFDIVAKLISLITEESVTAPYYEYTLPYVLMALEQDDDDAVQDTIDFLLQAAMTTKTSWQDTTWGIDGAAPMLRAIAPYRDTNADIAALVEETTTLITAYQGDDGSMGNAASTGLAMVGLAAAGVDPETVLTGGKNLLDGLMHQSNETHDGFLPAETSFGTEQGLRGLIAWKLFGAGKMIYDFKEYPQNEARATREVVIRPSWGGSSSSSTNKDKDKKPDKAEEKPQGLNGKHEDVKILQIVAAEKTFEDIQSHENQKAIEELAKRGVINGKSETQYCPDETMTRAEFAAIVVRALGVPQKEDGTFLDIQENDWFCGYVNTAFHYGIVNGVSENEFHPQGEITREEAATMVLRAATLCGMQADTSETEIRNTLAMFADYTQTSAWATTALAFCYQEELLDKSEIEIKPKTKITREEVAQIVYHMLDRAKLL